jgi:peptide/nickel transport system substrate-binding protein
VRLPVLIAAAALAACARVRDPSELLVAYPEGPASLLPHENNDEYASSILGNVFEPLVALDGDLKLVPALAESWHTPDDQTWVFTLRNGARWHGGDPVLAGEVVAALTAARDAPSSRRRAELAGVVAIEARDERNVAIRTRSPMAPLMNRLSQVPVFRPASRPGGLPSGTGPYALEGWERGREVRLAAQPPKLPLRRVRFLVVPHRARQVAMLRGGQVHVVTDLTPAEARELRASPQVRVVSRKGLLVHFVAMDCGRERTPFVAAERNPFRERGVRRAVALGLDRQALVSGPLEGEGEVVDQIVGPQVFGFDPELAPWPHDVDASRGLLAAAGWPQGFDVELDFAGEPEGSAARATAALAEQLLRIGIRARPRAQDLASLMRRVESRDTSFYVMAWISSAGDFSSSAEYLLRTPENGYGIDNGGLYSNPEVDALLERAVATPLPAQRLALLRQVARLVHDDVPVVPLYRRSDIYAVAADLAFEPRLDRDIRGAQIRWR